MNKTAEILVEILANEKKRIRPSYLSNDVVFPLIEIIRTLDYHTFMISQGVEVKNPELLFEKYRFGWSLPFLLYYKDLDLSKNIPLFSYEIDDRRWLDQIVQHSGCVQITSQFLDYCKADLMTVASADNQTFTFSYLIENPGLEFFEKLSIGYYFSSIEGILLEKEKGFFSKLPEIRKNLEGIVNVAFEKFITYKATDEFDEFYSKFGYLYLMTTQIVDDFAENDTFGGISYKTFLNQVEYVCRAAIMHRDCCMALAEKTSHKIYLRNILTHALSLNTFSNSLAEYFEEKPEVIRETISCLTINKDNFEHHLSYPGASAPPYFQIEQDTLMQSVYGSLDKPVLFLNRELKRKFPKDFFNAVNNREARFKKQLYDFFEEERIIKIYENIIIKASKGETDIDAIVFDRHRNKLGLFQLKWQDSFSTSMKERFSRISNSIPKSVEWIDKISDWLKSNDARTILDTLRIGKEYSTIEEVHLFVISRNHVHFTNQILDDRAVWASWFQVIEASAKIKEAIKIDPIGEFAAKLKFFSPDARMKREQLPSISDFELKFAKYRVNVKT